MNSDKLLKLSCITLLGALLTYAVLFGCSGFTSGNECSNAEMILFRFFLAIGLGACLLGCFRLNKALNKRALLSVSAG